MHCRRRSICWSRPARASWLPTKAARRSPSDSRRSASSRPRRTGAPTAACCWRRPGSAQFISGVILYEETLGQRADDGTPLPELAARQGIVPGIKVDAGKIALAHAPGDEITQGLDGLAKRLGAYKEQGARFAKWRAVYNVSDTLPSRLAIEANADALARYAAICQARRRGADRRARGADGRRSHARALRRSDRSRAARSLPCAASTPGGARAHAAEAEHGGCRQGAGRSRRRRPRSPRRRCACCGARVPAAVPGIFFLSGGQTPAEATRPPRRDEPARAAALGAELLVRARAAGPGAAGLEGTGRQCAQRQDALLERARLNSAARGDGTTPRWRPCAETRAGHHGTVTGGMAPSPMATSGTMQP